MIRCEEIEIQANSGMEKLTNPELRIGKKEQSDSER